MSLRIFLTVITDVSIWAVIIGLSIYAIRTR